MHIASGPTASKLKNNVGCVVLHVLVFGEPSGTYVPSYRRTPFLALLRAHITSTSRRVDQLGHSQGVPVSYGTPILNYIAKHGQDSDILESHSIEINVVSKHFQRTFGVSPSPPPCSHQVEGAERFDDCRNRQYPCYPSPLLDLMSLLL